ncbi:helix-turn-helix domain-containing protein [Actinomadura viridis]|uniref:helix-turn-helix domain-containing protein n=1 Tax=Actinomadura viridis TaxID=58110 RepID=UPI0036C3A60E
MTRSVAYGCRSGRTTATFWGQRGSEWRTGPAGRDDPRRPDTQSNREDGITVTAIARRAGLRRSTVSAWTSGTRGATRPPDRELLIRLARGLRCPESVVLAAAGVREAAAPPTELREVILLALYRELPQGDRQLAEQILRAMACREPTTST